MVRAALLILMLLSMVVCMCAPDRLGVRDICVAVMLSTGLRRFEKYFEPVTKRLPKRVPGWQSMTKLYESFTKKEDKQS